MKSAYQYYRGAAFIACCLLGACHIASTDSASDEGGSGPGGATAAAGREERGGNTAAGGTRATVTARAGAADVSAAGQAGGGNEAGDGGNEAGDGASGATSSDDGGAGPQSAPLDPASECDIDGGCISKCPSDTVNCTVEFPPGECEFEAFRDIPTSVTCGQSVTVGIANCGGCGSVAVQVYYDGSYCWQGIPDCMLPQFVGKFLNPHAPLP
jgi:hypothetical protein